MQLASFLVRELKGLLACCLPIVCNWPGVQVTPVDYLADRRGSGQLLRS